VQPRRYRQPGEKDRGSIASFRAESLAGADILRILRAAGLRDGPETVIDNQVPYTYY